MTAHQPYPIPMRAQLKTQRPFTFLNFRRHDNFRASGAGAGLREDLSAVALPKFLSGSKHN